MGCREAGEPLMIAVFEHAPGQGDGIVDAIQSVDNQLQVTMVKAYESLDHPNQIDGVVLSGGPMSVLDIDTEALSFMREEVALLRQLIDKGVPVLGICLGHQLLAHIAGGQISRCAAPEIGCRDIIWDADGTSRPVFQWHEDEVSVPPEHTQTIATSASCRVQALQYLDRPMISVQFHPEVDERRGQYLVETRAPAGVDVAGCSMRVDQEFRLSVFAQFIQLVRAGR